VHHMNPRKVLVFDLHRQITHAHAMTIERPTPDVATLFCTCPQLHFSTGSVCCRATLRFSLPWVLSLRVVSA
jgi:hypothetical protein